jgi:hypothetical protein
MHDIERQRWVLRDSPPKRPPPPEQRLDFQGSLLQLHRPAGCGSAEQRLRLVRQRLPALRAELAQRQQQHAAHLQPARPVGTAEAAALTLHSQVNGPEAMRICKQA